MSCDEEVADHMEQLFTSKDFVIGSIVRWDHGVGVIQKEANHLGHFLVYCTSVPEFSPYKVGKYYAFGRAVLNYHPQPL